MTEIVSSRAKDKLEGKLMLHSSEEPYNKAGNLPGKKCGQVVVHPWGNLIFKSSIYLLQGILI